jgi:hypothetical protein
MKKSSFILQAVALSFALVFTTSCMQEGCTDPEAANYDKKAVKDDGHCIYRGGVVFWYDETDCVNLQNDGVISLTLYVDGEIIGSYDASVYWSDAPVCGEHGSITVHKEWENSRTHIYSYSVVDQTGWEHWGDDAVTFEANTCIKLHLMTTNRKKK